LESILNNTEMAFTSYKTGEKAEALDMDGVWHECEVIERRTASIIIHFTAWSSKYDREISEEEEVRPLTVRERMSRARNPTKGNYKVLLKLI
jgi:hypothetical protein